MDAEGTKFSFISGSRGDLGHCVCQVGAPPKLRGRPLPASTAIDVNLCNAGVGRGEDAELFTYDCFFTMMSMLHYKLHDGEGIDIGKVRHMVSQNERVVRGQCKGSD